MVHEMDARVPIWSAILCGAFAGCGGTPSETTAASAPDQEPFKPLPLKEVAQAELPKLNDYLGKIDTKVEVAPPQGWIPKTRSKEYLVAFVRDKSSAVPAIVVRATDTAEGDIADVTEDNVVDYAIAVQATLSDPIESARPMKIVDRYFVRYVKDARISDLPAEVQVLMTVREGRTYIVELRVRDVADLKKYKAHAYAVAAGLKFVADDKPFEFKPQPDPAQGKPEDSKPADPPAADVKPAEPPPAPK
jgi:hypothetical protein